VMQAAEKNTLRGIHGPVAGPVTTEPAYAAALVPGGDLVMSGFLEADTAAVTQAAAEQGMETVAAETREGWMMIRVKKKK